MTIENQPELFEDFNNQKQKRYKRPKLFTRKKIHISLSYENIVLFSIIFLMLVVLIFSLGVERGKRINIASRVQKLEAKKLLEVSPPQHVEIQKDALNSKSPESKKVKLATFYTIQVVTYRREAMVEKEMKKLRNEGYQPFVMPYGNLSQICVGRFESKSLANKVLTKLRRRYKDCFIKKIEILEGG